MYQIIMHNQVSLNGAISGFQYNPSAYHKIMNGFKSDMYLVGSNAALHGMKHFMKETSPETPGDFKKPSAVPGDQRPYWVIPDSEGKLEGHLHAYRNFKHCRDIIILATAQTPDHYLQYLKERNYTTIIAGDVKVDFKNAFDQLHKIIPFDIILTDNNGSLSAVLLDQGLIDLVSLIISPVLTGKKQPVLFRHLRLGKRVIQLEPQKVELLDSNDIHLLMKIIK
jgi:2,5-diamino-6-(ribosylamino)-4(3H)-pyrimidinone 5'-phosphate reductase